MLFNSLDFLIFFPVVFLLYFISPKKVRPIILLISSYVFYMWWNVSLIFLILFITVLSYLCGIMINKSHSLKLKKIYVIIGIIGSLILLIFFKYFNFFANSIIDIVSMFGGRKNNIAFNIILPVGISFYTFQTLSYVIDIYKGKIDVEKNFIYYALYVSFFPQLVAGPIERPDNLLPQLKKDKKIEINNLSQGLKFMLIGFFKKVAIADMVGIYVNIVYNDIKITNGLMVLVASLLFAVQILCDFSGYSDIAVGCAKCFGIDLMKNFDKPYSSKSIKEFWNRWHISLSSWFKDYVYFPLGGSRVSKYRWALNILVVFLISGLWHGAAYTFILWGILHGIYQIIGKLTKNARAIFTNKINIKTHKILQVIICFILVDIGWIIFRSNNINDMVLAFEKLIFDFNLSTSSIKYMLSVFNINYLMIIYIIVVIGSLYFIDKIPYSNKKYCKILYIVMGWSIIGAWIFLQSSEISSSFIYFQF